jgi:hypothetical protein
MAPGKWTMKTAGQAGYQINIKLLEAINKYKL